MGQHGVTQLEVAAALGLESSSVSRKLAGSVTWKLGEIRDLAEFLSQRLGRLVEWDEIIDPINAPKLVGRGKRSGRAA